MRLTELMNLYTCRLNTPSALNPDPENLPKLDPKDEFLASDPAGSSGTYTNGQNGSTPSTPSLAQVTWLRKTEYLSRDSSHRSGGQEPCVLFTYLGWLVLTVLRKHLMMEAMDVSRAAQLRDIEASFVACNDNFSLETLKHPNKPKVTAVESYEVLPDADIWANQYDLFRFSERPGEKALEVCGNFASILDQSTQSMSFRWKIYGWTAPSSDP